MAGASRRCGLLVLAFVVYVCVCGGGCKFVCVGMWFGCVRVCMFGRPTQVCSHVCLHLAWCGPEVADPEPRGPEPRLGFHIWRRLAKFRERGRPIWSPNVKLEFPFALSCRSHRWETQPKCMPLQPNFTAKGRLAGGWGAFRRCLATSASRPRPVRWSSGAPSLRWGGWGRPCAWRLQIGDFGHFSYWRLAGCGHSRTRIPRVHPSRPEVMRDEPQANYNDMLDPLRQSKNKQTRTGSCALRERLREPSRGRCHLAGRCSGARTGGQGELTQTNGASSMPFLPIY